jgi:Na+/melibiose symporter-like transporter
MTEDNYERFAKWQGATREQLGATSNLILGLATGLLGFATVLLLEGKLVISRAFGFGVAASILLALSVALALWCATNRLKDFRLTAKIANPKNSGSPQLEEFREESKRLGERTWGIFRVQIWSFALGVGTIGVSIIIQLFS